MFYDGVNELWSGLRLDVDGLGDVARPYQPTLEDLWIQVSEDDTAEIPPRPDGAEILPSTPAGPADGMSADQIAQLVSRRYDRSRGMSRDVAAAHEVPIHWYWQPSRLSRPPNRSENLEDPSDPNTFNRDVHTATEAAVPEGVHDVTNALDGTVEPFFTDDTHHNEAAAELIAEAMYPHLLFDIVEASSDGSP